MEDVRGLLVHAHIGNCVLDKITAPTAISTPIWGLPGGENDVKEVTAFIEKLFDIGFLGQDERPFFGFEVKDRNWANRPGPSSPAPNARSRKPGRTLVCAYRWERRMRVFVTQRIFPEGLELL